MSKECRFYDENADLLYSHYRSLKTEDVFSDMLHFFPTSPCTVLDIGAGSGRDSLWLAERGHNVYAVEPSREFRNRIAEAGANDKITLIDARLPKLSSDELRRGKFDFILCSAVWMHLDAQERRLSLARFADLLNPKRGNGVLVQYKISPPEPQRNMYQLSQEILNQEFRSSPFEIVHASKSDDIFGRSETSWKAVFLGPKLNF